MLWPSPQPQADPAEGEGTTKDGEEEDVAATDIATPKHATNAAASTTWHEIANSLIQANKRPTTPQP